MLNKLYTPDVMKRFKQIQQYSQNNQKAMETLYRVLVDRAYLESVYSQQLDQLSQQLNIIEDGIINDDIVDIIQAYRSVLICEKEQADFFKDSIRNDLILLFKDLITKQNETIQQLEIKSISIDKELRNNLNKMQRKANKYCQTLIELPLAKSETIKFMLEKEKQQHKIELIQTISDYNKFVSKYFEICVEQQDNVYNLEKERRIVFNDVQMKLQVFHVSIIKNIEYALKKMNQKIEAQDLSKSIFQFENIDTNIPVLNKYNINDYIYQLEFDVLQPQFSNNSQSNGQVSNDNLNTVEKLQQLSIKNIWESMKQKISKEQDK